MREPISTVQYRVFRDARKNLFLSEKCLCNIVVAAAAAVYTAWFPLNQCPCPLKWIVFSCCLPRGQTHCTDDTKHDFRISMSFVCQRVALHSPSCCNLTSFGEVSCLSCFFCEYSHARTFSQNVEIHANCVTFSWSTSILLWLAPDARKKRQPKSVWVLCICVRLHLKYKTG